MIRPVKCYLCRKPMHYAGHPNHVPELQVDTDAGVKYIHAKCWEKAPAMYRILNQLEFAARVRDNIMGDPCSLLAAKAELAEAAKEALELICKLKGTT